MSGKLVESFRCAHCNKGYRWDARFAGRWLMCTCGQSLQVPALDPNVATAASSDQAATPTPASASASRSASATSSASHPPSVQAHREASTGEETYELAKEDGPAESSEGRPLLVPPVPVAPPTVDAHTSDEVRQEGVRISTGISSIFLDVYVPVSIMLVGLFVTVGLWRHHFPEEWSTTAIAIFSVVTMQAVLMVPIAIASALIVANMMDLELGPLIPAAIKLAAITFGPAALADGLLFGILQHDFDYELLLLGFVLYLIFIGAPTWAWFRTDLQETTLLVSMQALPRLILFFLAAAVAPKLFGIVK